MKLNRFALLCHEEQIHAMHGHVLLNFCLSFVCLALIQVQCRLQHANASITKIICRVANCPNHSKPFAVQLLGLVKVQAVMAAEGLSSGKFPAAYGAALQLLKAEACTRAASAIREGLYTECRAPSCMILITA